MLRKMVVTQNNTGTWAASNAGIQTALDRPGLMTRLDMTVELVPSATLTGANQPDGPWRLIQNHSISGSSGKTYMVLPSEVTCNGGVMLHYMNLLDHGMAGSSTGVILAPSRTYMPITFRFHPGSRPRMRTGIDNPFDMSAFVPLTMESQVNAVWVTAGNNVLDSIVTITSAVMRYTISAVQGTEQELLAEMAAQGVQIGNPGSDGRPTFAGAIPAWSAELFSHTATASDYSTKRDIPTGAWLRRIFMVVKDSTATRSKRSQEAVTAVSIDLPNDGTSLIKRFVDAITDSLPYGSFIKANDALEAGVVNAPQGVFPIDLRPHGNLDYGLNLTNFGSGTVKLGLTITNYTSGDASLILYERYMPYTGRLAP